MTVVVPVYGDLPSLLDCTDALLEQVDDSVDRVLFVNDCGPDADLIETALLARITGHPGFRYERNGRNLGFVGTCNRAVYELDRSDNDVLLLNSDTLPTAGFIDELCAVLHAAPEHGAVCARTNNGTIASLPFTLRDPSAGRTIERTAVVHAAVRDLLPRFTIAPVAMGFCLLIRRELIERYGLFDEAFSPGYGEENDFCLRIAADGYRAVIANRALVFHRGARSFTGARRAVLRTAHESLLVKRYPNYPAAVRTYLYQERDPIDALADAIVPGNSGFRILIDLEPRRHLDALDLCALDNAAEIARATGTRISVCVPDRLLNKIAPRYKELDVRSSSSLDGLWDAAIATGSSGSSERAIRLNRIAPRWAVLAETSALLHDHEGTIWLGSSTTPIADALARAPQWNVDPAQLRRRWRRITADLTVRQLDRVIVLPAATRLLQRVQRASPRVAAHARAVATRVLRRS